MLEGASPFGWHRPPTVVLARGRAAAGRRRVTHRRYALARDRVKLTTLSARSRRWASGVSRRPRRNQDLAFRPLTREPVDDGLPGRLHNSYVRRIVVAFGGPIQVSGSRRTSSAVTTRKAA